MRQNQPSFPRSACESGSTMQYSGGGWLDLTMEILQLLTHRFSTQRLQFSTIHTLLCRNTTRPLELRRSILKACRISAIQRVAQTSVEGYLLLMHCQCLALVRCLLLAWIAAYDVTNNQDYLEFAMGIFQAPVSVIYKASLVKIVY